MWNIWVISFMDGPLEFDSQANLASVREPVLILHAEDDNVVPHELGESV